MHALAQRVGWQRAVIGCCASAAVTRLMQRAVAGSKGAISQHASMEGATERPADMASIRSPPVVAAAKRLGGPLPLRSPQATSFGRWKATFGGFPWIQQRLPSALHHLLGEAQRAANTRAKIVGRHVPLRAGTRRPHHQRGHFSLAGALLSCVPAAEGCDSAKAAFTLQQRPACDASGGDRLPETIQGSPCAIRAIEPVEDDLDADRPVQRKSRSHIEPQMTCAILQDDMFAAIHAWGDRHLAAQQPNVQVECRALPWQRLDYQHARVDRRFEQDPGIPGGPIRRFGESGVPIAMGSPPSVSGQIRARVRHRS